jgi:putative ubiquitin-RnfH superfamily antitoxin RatB of RatAB toxin-antitoxin module
VPDRSRVLQPRDRVEIYRPLINDPKETRARRAREQRERRAREAAEGSGGDAAD